MGYQRDKINEIRDQLSDWKLIIFTGYSSENTENVLFEVLHNYHYIFAGNKDDLISRSDDIKKLNYDQFLIVQLNHSSYKHSNLLDRNNRHIKGISIPDDVNLILLVDSSRYDKFYMNNEEDLNLYDESLIVEVDREFKTKSGLRSITF